jgi:hypothetical protein
VVDVALERIGEAPALQGGLLQVARDADDPRLVAEVRWSSPTVVGVANDESATPRARANWSIA